jgi:non-ribosomal peptide synthetase component F/NADPH:quinone reductase-like Zn-dependent oxidoreductase/acyl carrier protein
LGAGGKGFREGQRVMGLIPGGLRKYGLTYPEFIVPIPEHFSFEQAATLPYDYLTAYYALSYITRLEENDRLLIHNADNPTGMALLNVARHMNAEIFATVHYEKNAPLLKKAGASHVFSSNTPEYIDEILKLTDGEGVDAIANTGSQEQLVNNFALLKDFGRFLELNPGGSFQQSIVYHNLRYNVSFFAIDLEHLAKQQPKLIARLFREILPDIENGRYTPLDHQTFDAREINVALAHLKAERHIEIPVILISGQETKKSAQAGLFRQNGSYVVIGDLSPANLALIKWMRDNGAQNMYALSLSTTPQSADLPESVTFLSDLQNGLPDDTIGVIASIDGIPMESAEYAKEILSQAFAAGLNTTLDFFITAVPFKLINIESSIAGSTTFNNLLMAQHAQRWRQGLPSVHVEMGGPQKISESIAYARWQIIKELLFLEKGHLIITETKWKSVFSKKSSAEIPGFFSELISKQEPAQSTDSGKAVIDRTDILATEPEHRFDRIRQYLAHELAGVIKVSPDQIGHQQPLTQFGIDSLMAIELKNNIERQLGVNIPIASLLQGPSINDLTSSILEQLEDETVETPKVKIKDKSSTQTEIIEAPLSHGQRAMYFQHTMNPESIFNLAYAVRIRSEFDKEILRDSFQALVDRHPSLRTTFHLKDGEPIQRIHPTMPAFFIEEDLQNADETTVRERLQQEVQSYFDLENGPLMRIYLFKRAENDYILLFVMHHIVTDIWSQAVLLDELSQIFEHYGDPSVLPPIEADYTDFVAWQDELLKSEKGEQLFQYWKQKLAGDLPVLNLPTDRPRPPVQTFKGSTETLWLPAELSDAVHRFCETHEVTPFTVLLAAYYLLLSRYTQQNDIIIGSPTAGRTVNEFARTVGYFVNPLPFRAKISDNESFLQFLDQVKETALEAFEHMDYPLTLLVEKLQPERDPSRTPLFQTMFVLERAHLLHDQGLSQFALSREGAQLNLGGLTIESMDLEQGVAPFDLTMMIVESGKGLAASLGYNVDLFEAATIRRMLEHYLTLISSIIRDPKAPVKKLEILPRNERELLIEHWSKSEDFDLSRLRCVHKTISENAKRLAQKTALIFENQTISYAELENRSNQIAHFLRKKQVGPETIVGICLDRSPEMIEAILGVLKAGAAYLPLDPAYPPERIRYMLDDSHVQHIITESTLQNRIIGNGVQIILLDEDSEITRMPTSTPEVDVDLRNLAYIIYTSGSTGKPKGTMLQHLGLANVLESTRAIYHVTENSRTLQFASFSFDASVEEIFSTLTAGGTLVLARKETLLSLGELIELIKKHEITNITLPPSVLNILRPEDFPSLKSVVSAGEKCPAELAKR